MADEPTSEHTVDAPPGLAGYRAGCRCDDCRLGNTETKRRQRERRQERERAAALAAARGGLRVVADGEVAADVDDDVAADWEPTPYTVAEHLLEALNEIPGDDTLTRYRKTHAITLAQVLDDPMQTPRWAGITRALITVLAFLIRDAGSVDNEGEELKAFFAAIAARRPSG